VEVLGHLLQRHGLVGGLRRPFGHQPRPGGGRERREPRHEGGQRLDGQRVDRLHGRQRGEIGPIYHRAS